MSRAEAGGSVAAVRVRGLTRTFVSYQALRGVDFDVARGESVVIFGPNGAGKTTLIKILATIMNPTSGRILIDGFDLKEQPERLRRKLGVVTHQTFLYNNLTANENLEFYARMYGVPDARQRIRDVVSMVGMTSRAHDRVGAMSRGMQQRFSIARALLHRPEIVLLDEPETGLDQQAISMFWQILKADDGKNRSVIMTTHSLERGLELCDRLLILSRGKMVYESLTCGLQPAELRRVYQEMTASRS